MRSRILFLLVLCLVCIHQVAHSGPIGEPHPDNPNFFLRLGIDPNDPDLDNAAAADDLVKKAYRIAARKYHPDLHPELGVEGRDFKLILEAYENLAEGGKREFYRRFTAAGFGTTEAKPPHSPMAKGMDPKVIEAEVYKRLKQELEDHWRGRLAHHLFGDNPDEPIVYSRFFAEGFTNFVEAVQKRVLNDGYYSTVHPNMSLPRETEYHQPSERALYRFLSDMLPLFGSSSPTEKETHRVAQGLLMRHRTSFDSRGTDPASLLPALWYQAYTLAPDEAQRRRILPGFLYSHLTGDLDAGQRLEHLREALAKLRPDSGTVDEKEQPVADALLEVFSPVLKRSLQRSDFHYGELRDLMPNIARVLNHTPEGRHALLLFYDRIFSDLDKVAKPLPDHESSEYRVLQSGPSAEFNLRTAADHIREFYILRPLLDLLHESPDDLLHEALRRPTLKDQLRIHFTAFGFGRGVTHGRCAPLFDRFNKILGAKRQLPPPPSGD